MTNYDRIMGLDEEELACYLTDMLVSLTERMGMEVNEEMYYELVDISYDFLNSKYIKPSEYLS